ncbi:Oxysterol-binding protein-related protein 8 [Heterocephalus glaber]|uniref:Oxysterol-binding protein-related protein 8 n=1 Tax=Heterocephalus glaber TaxID=10181 RepID=G5C450_HETGA|nr:Oxysterol-binding protein-related protein 8 [Heterocephalus glaber]
MVNPSAFIKQLIPGLSCEVFLRIPVFIQITGKSEKLKLRKRQYRGCSKVINTQGGEREGAKKAGGKAVRRTLTASASSSVRHKESRSSHNLKGDGGRLAQLEHPLTLSGSSLLPINPQDYVNRSESARDFVLVLKELQEPGKNETAWSQPGCRLVLTGPECLGAARRGCDQTEATQEKYVLEEAQRQAARDRKTKNEEWTCKLFELDPLTGEWHYKFSDTRPWDPLNDMIQFEKDGVIQTKVKHRTPMVSVPKMKHKPTRQQKKVAKGYSSPEPDIQDSSGSEAQSVKPSTRRKKGIELGDIQSSIESIKQTQEEIKRNILALRNHLVSSTPATDYFLQQKDYFIIFLLILLQITINFMFK